MELTSENVKKIFLDCLLSDEDMKRMEFPEPEKVTPALAREKGLIVVEGVTHTVALNPGPLQRNREDIRSMLDQLRLEFRDRRDVLEGAGGGWSFLNLCDRRDGTQWTDLHLRMEELVILGEAAGYVQCRIPREMWRLLPGGMPYYVVDLRSDEQKKNDHPQMEKVG